MSQIDRVSTFIGEVVESTLGSTSGNGYPQWVARLKATKKYVSEPEEMKHFQIETPGYVDWSAYDESIIAYLVLFSDKGPLRNYEQLQAATGWDGQDFEALLGFAGKTILFRTEKNTYKDKTSIQVAWIDDKDAPPERTLGGVDKDEIKELNAKFLAGMKKAPAPAKPAVPAKPAAPKAEEAKAEAPKQPAPDSQPSASTATSPVPAGEKKTTPPAKKEKKSTPPPAQTSGTGLPPETTKDEAWEHLVKPDVRGANDESVVAEAWVAACAEVGENVDEERFTASMWGRVRDIVLKDLGVK